MAWNVKEKAKSSWNWMTEHPISFGRMLCIVGSILLTVFLFIVLQIVLGMLSGWFLFAEIVLAAVAGVTYGVNHARQYEIDRKKSPYRW